MIQDDNDESIENESLPNRGSDNQNQNPVQSQPSRRSYTEKNFMETEGRVFSDFYRNTSEEMFLRSLMEGSLGMAAPSMETLGFKNLSQNLRVDSQELFNSWLTNAEASRISTELAALSSQQQGPLFQNKSSNDNSVHNSSMCNDPSSDPSQSSLRRRYAAMQSIQTSTSMDGIHNMSGQCVPQIKQEFATISGFCDVSIGEMSNQLRTFMSSSNSSSTPFSSHPAASVDAVSSVVSMLKGTLERKKLSNLVDKETVEGGSLGYYGSQEFLTNMGSDQGAMSRSLLTSGTFPAATPGQIQDSRNLQMVDGSIDTEGFVSASNPIQMATASRETSQSESSAAAPALSAGLEKLCSGTGRPNKETPGGAFTQWCRMAEAKERNMTPSVPSDMQAILKRCENLEKEVRSLKLNLSFMNRCILSPHVRLPIYNAPFMNVRSAALHQVDPDFQIAWPGSQKHADGQETSLVVHSKDSEQTKQIEELQKQNEELAEEKERLLEEIERIIQESDKM
ncbi:hypothetical protein ACLOJK_029948 [Asimina triloba]